MGDVLQELRSRALDRATSGLDRIDRMELGPKSVHAIRVGGRRLRALWQLLVPVIDRGLSRSADARLRDANRLLAGARDAHVARTVLAKLIRQCERETDAVTLEAFLAALPHEETRRHELRVTALSGIYPKEIAEWRGLEVIASDAIAIREGIRRTYRKGRKRGGQAVASGEPLAYHRWRKWVKYLLHQLQALEQRLGDWQRADIEKLDRLADDLGKFNDLHNLLLIAPPLSLDGTTRARACQIIARRADLLRRRAGELYADIYRSTPNAYAASIAEAATAPQAFDLDLAVAD